MHDRKRHDDQDDEAFLFHFSFSKLTSKPIFRPLNITSKLFSTSMLTQVHQLP